MQDYHYPPNYRGINEFQCKERGEGKGVEQGSLSGNKTAKNTRLVYRNLLPLSNIITLQVLSHDSCSHTAIPDAQGSQGGNPEKKQQEP